MKLHHFAHSSARFRVRIALALKGIGVEYVRVDMPSGEQRGEAYAALNPQRLVPCLMKHLAALNEVCLAHPAFQAAHPDRWDA